MKGTFLIQTKKLAAVLMALLLLGGCSSWRRDPSTNHPKEIPTSASVPDEQTGTEDTQQTVEEVTAGEEANEAQVHTEDEAVEYVSAEVTSSADETVSWSSTDEILSRRLYDLLMNKNELFTEKFDERVYDYLAVITDSEGNRHELYLWINFQRENEIIVEDIQGEQWNLSVEDSNQVRSIVSSLN